MTDSIPEFPEHVKDEAVAAVRRPPHSLESEQSILGGLMLDTNAFEIVSDILSVDDFYRREHQIIYEAIERLAINAKPVDAVTVLGELQAIGKVQDVGGMQYLDALVHSTPSAANIRRYAEIVRERSILRQLISAGDEIVSLAYSPEAADVSQLLDQIQTKIFAIDENSNRGKKGFVRLPEVAANVTKEVQALYEEHSNDDVTGLPTGFIKLDRMLTGLHPSDLVIVAGRPSMGKTSFALNIVEYVGIVLKLPVAIFSMEMSADQLAKRFISSTGRVDAQKIRRARLDNSDWQRFTDAVAEMSKAPIYIDDSSALTVNEVRARARRLARKSGPLSLIVVDYLQLMSGSARAGSSTENRATEISEISRGLKNLAKEMNAPVIALSQLNRAVESRGDRRPMMSDIRESGAIEQDADVIMFIYRDVVYNKDCAEPNKAEIIIGKQRNGPIGTIDLRFDGEFTRFDNLAEEAELPPELRN